jgi:sugar lactone lactonase YvrE
MKRTLVAVLMVVLLLPSFAAAQHNLIWIKTYNPALGEFPEGIAMDLWGNIYVSMAPIAQVRKISPAGSETILHQFDPALGLGLTGLTVDAYGNVYVATVGFPPDPANLNNPNQGVWRIDQRGHAWHLPGTEHLTLPNALAFDHRGNLYVTDSWVQNSDPPEGAIWRMTRSGQAERWYQDVEYLGGAGNIPLYPPIGANGIVYHRGDLYVANTEKGHIVRIPVLPDGEPGEPTILHSDLLLVDGITLDVQGTIFAAMIGGDSVLGICPRTGLRVVLASAEDGVDGPASVTFGVGPDRLRTLFFTNYAALSLEPDPGIVKLELDWPRVSPP